MSGADLVAWYGIGYLASLVLGLTFLVVGILGLGHGDAHAPAGDGHDAGHDADHGAGHDVAHGDAHAVAGDADAAAAHHALLDFLGIGRCPLSLILMTLCFLFAFFGLASIIILKQLVRSGLLVGLVSYPAALVLAALVTGRIARLIGRFMPTAETYVAGESSLVGSVGKAVYAFSGERGFVQVYDRNNTLQEVRAVCAEPGQAIRAGDDVLLIDYDGKERVFRVQRAPGEVALPEKGGA
jgi:membrane protein implicated in regulation of membrane protease activity